MSSCLDKFFESGGRTRQGSSESDDLAADVESNSESAVDSLESLFRIVSVHNFYIFLKYLCLNMCFLPDLFARIPLKDLKIFVYPELLIFYVFRDLIHYKS